MSLVQGNLQALLQKLLSPNSKIISSLISPEPMMHQFEALHHRHRASLAGPTLRTRHSFLHLFKAAASQELTLWRMSPRDKSEFLTDTNIHVFNTRGLVSHSLKPQRNSHASSAQIISQLHCRKMNYIFSVLQEKKKNQVVSDTIKSRICWIKNTMQSW